MPEPFSATSKKAPFKETTGYLGVTQAIVSPISALTALAMKLYQPDYSQMGKRPYEIRYYLHTDENIATPSKFRLAVDENENPERLEPLNQPMHAAAMYAMKVLTAQLPGRFAFREVDDPEQAMMLFTGISRESDPDKNGYRSSRDFLGKVSSVGSVIMGGVVMLNEAAYQSDSDTTYMYLTALHEVGHVLGLRHPQDHGALWPSYYDSVMSYSRWNNLGYLIKQSDHITHLNIGELGYPVTFMPADLNGLVYHYPLDTDEQAITTGPAFKHSDFARVHVTSLGAAMRPQGVPFPEEGVAYYAQRDTEQDTLVISGNLDRLQPPKPSQRSRFRQIANGTEITQYTTEGKASTVLIGGKPEVIVLASDIAHDVELSNNMHLLLQRAPLAEGDIKNSHKILVKGGKNQITLAVDQLMQQAVHVALRLGSETHIMVQGADQLAKMTEPLPMDKLFSPNVVTDSKPHISWKLDNDKRYQLKIEADDQNLKPIQLTFELDTKDPLAHAKFQASIEQSWDILRPGEDYKLVPTRSDEPKSTVRPLVIPAKTVDPKIR